MSFDYSTFSTKDVAAHRLSATTSTLTITDIDTDEDVRCYFDLGIFTEIEAGYKFGFHFNISSASDGSRCYVWGLDDSALNLYDVLEFVGLDGHAAYVENDGGTHSLVFAEYNSGVKTSQSFTLSTGTDYYVTAIRDESVGEYGTLEFSVYSDYSRTSHISGSPKTISLTEKKDFRYLWGMCSYDSSVSDTSMSLIVSNLSYIGFSQVSLGAIISKRITESLGVDSILANREGGSVSVDAVLEFQYHEMWDYLSTVTPNSAYTLDVKPNSVLTEVCQKNGIVRMGDDRSESRISFDDDSIFYVTLQWNPVSEADSGAVMDFYHSIHKGNGMTKSFNWIHYGEPSGRRHTYVVRFASSLPRSVRRGNIYGISNIRLKVLGRA